MKRFHIYLLFLTVIFSTLYILNEFVRVGSITFKDRMKWERQFVVSNDGKEDYKGVLPRDPALISFNNVRALIMKTQFPLSCVNSCFYSLSYNHPHGFGSRTHLMAAGLSVALEKGCIFVAETKTAPEWAGIQPLQPLTNCTVNLSSRRKIKKIGKAALQNVLMRHTPKLGDLRIPITVWLTAATTFLLRPTPEFDTKLQNIMKESIWHDECQESVLGIHVRQNDKGSEAKLLPFSFYLEEVAQWEKITRTHLRCLYIATDNAKLKRNIESAKFVRRPQKDEKDSYRVIVLSSKFRELSSFEQVLLELHILSRTQTLAFTFSSNFGRLAMFLNPNNLMHSSSLDEMPKLIPLDYYQRVNFGPRSKSYGFFFIWSEIKTYICRDCHTWIILPVPINDVHKLLSCNPAKVGCSYDNNKVLSAQYKTYEKLSGNKDSSCCKLFPRKHGKWPAGIGPNVSTIFSRDWQRMCNEGILSLACVQNMAKMS